MNRVPPRPPVTAALCPYSPPYASATAPEGGDGLPAQAIGTRTTKAVAGNHGMLDLGHGEYAMLAHLRRGSVAVEAGQQVAAGDELGRCGNSGNTSEPH